MVQGIYDDDMETVAYHLQAGIDPNYEHPEVMCTPLIEAIRHDRGEAIELLVHHGADPLMRSNYDEMNAYEAIEKWKKKHLLCYLPPRKSWIVKLKEKFAR